MDVIGAIDFLDLGGNRVLIIPTKGAPTVALLFASSRRSFSPQRSHTVTPFPLYFLSLLHARKNPIHSERCWTRIFRKCRRRADGPYGITNRRTSIPERNPAIENHRAVKREFCKFITLYTIQYRLLNKSWYNRR